MSKQPTSSLVVSAFKELAPLDEQVVRLTVDAAIDGTPSLVEISITTELAAKVAIALLATTEQARSHRDGMAPALAPIAVGVVDSGDAEKIRLQMLFEKGGLLPVELLKPAAVALSLALETEINAPLQRS